MEDDRRPAAAGTQAEASPAPPPGAHEPLALRITLAIVAVLFVCMGSGTLLVHRVVTDSFGSAEADLVLRNRAVVAGAIASETAFLRFTVTDWGHWDDLYAYAAGTNPQFAESELNGRGVQRLNLDALLVLAPDGKALAGNFSPAVRSMDPDGSRVQAAIARILDALRRLGDGTEEALPELAVSGVLHTPLGTLALAAQPIRRTDTTGTPTGTLVMARRLDPERISAALSVLPAQVRIHAGTDIPDELHRLIIAADARGESAQLVAGKETISDYQLYRDINGEPAFLLELRMARVLGAAAADATRFIAIIGVTAMVLVLVTLLVVLRRLVVTPLTRLTDHLQGLRSRNQAGPVPCLDQADEIGMLARGFDALLNTRRAHEAELARLAAAVEHAGDSIAIMDRQGCITYVNPQYERQTGNRAGNVLGGRPRGGCSPQAVYDGLWDAVHRGEDWHGLLESTRPDGTHYLEDVTVAPIRDPGGEIMSYVAVMRDVTASRESESRIRKLAAAVESAAEAIVVMDRSGRIEYCNPAYVRQRSLTPEQILGRHPSETGRGLDDRAYYVAIWDEVLRGRSWRGEIRTQRRDGTVMIEEAVLSPIRNENGEVDHCVGVLHDLTGRRQLEAELAEARRLEAVGQLAAGVAHEINTPIQYVGDNIRFLQESFGTVAPLLAALAEQGASARSVARLAEACDPAEAEYLRTEVPRAIAQSLEGVERVAEIVRSMKELAWPGRNFAPADLNRVVTSAIAVAGAEWKPVAELSTCLDSALPSVPCLAGSINQVVVNMLVNAAQAIRALPPQRRGAGRITVTTRVRDGFAEIEIGDNGVGMSREVRARVFEPFFTTKGVGEGTGQGLAIAHAVVKKHGGEILVNSSPGAGAVFVVRLPLSSAAARDRAA